MRTTCLNSRGQAAKFISGHDMFKSCRTGADNFKKSHNGHATGLKVHASLRMPKSKDRILAYLIYFLTKK